MAVSQMARLGPTAGMSIAIGAARYVASLPKAFSAALSRIKGSEDSIARWKEINPNVNIKLEHFPYEELNPTIQTAMPAKNEADLIDMFGTWVHSYI